MVYNCLNFIRTRLFPPQCRLCLAPGETGLDLCDDCREELPWQVAACRQCARPLPDEGLSDLCASCLVRPPVLDACQAVFAYRPPVDGWIQGLKFNQDLTLAHLLGELLAEHIEHAPIQPDTQLLPVPLHARRLRQRGFNQALELSRGLVKRGYALATIDCRRNRHTDTQSTLPANRRGANVRDAFSVRGEVPSEDILLIDDVMTTGATLNELARTLKRAGAARVLALVVARAAKK